MARAFKKIIVDEDYKQKVRVVKSSRLTVVDGVAGKGRIGRCWDVGWSGKRD